MTIRRQDLIDFAAGDLTGPDANAVERALTDNPAAADLVARYRQVAALRATDDSDAPTPAAVARAKAIFRAAPRAASDWAARLREVVASIVWDSRLQPAAVRRAGTADFQLTAEAEAEDLSVDLSFSRQGDGNSPRWRLAGQLTTGTPAATEAELREAETHDTVVVRVDEHGMFEADVRAGEWNLVIRHGDTAFIIKPIVLP